MMSDAGRDGRGAIEEDRLPWLEPVDEEPLDDGVSAARLIIGLVVALVALGLVVGGVYWLKQRRQPEVALGDPRTIAAPAGPYKVRPSEPGGMQVAGQGDSSYAASEGVDVNGQIDLSAMPEAPLTKPQPAKTPAVAPTPAPAAAPAQTPAPQTAPPAKPVATPAAKPAPAHAATPAPAPKPTLAPKPAPALAATSGGGGGGGQIQLGAFSSEAKAKSAWTALSGRFAALSGLSPLIQPIQSNGKTVYRLRAAAGGRAGEVCGKLRVAGETCLVIG
ncbi:SPOR domain-containing protein [Sphingomonas morindae]|uniref:SPOR domain-containing protein n=1 Tax=Sphingomonas morindae TaxID=1541170 RepID=A0ABY4X8Y0_9SPHN|nr:SPOR domain-containing protein [Sphingomonas morindae]USI73305.1 SPOR domain-containing protein [Sphingomonas morindae]